MRSMAKILIGAVAVVLIVVGCQDPFLTGETDFPELPDELDISEVPDEKWFGWSGHGERPYRLTVQALQEVDQLTVILSIASKGDDEAPIEAKYIQVICYGLKGEVRWWETYKDVVFDVDGETRSAVYQYDDTGPSKSIKVRVWIEKETDSPRSRWSRSRRYKRNYIRLRASGKVQLLEEASQPIAYSMSNWFQYRDYYTYRYSVVMGQDWYEAYQEVGIVEKYRQHLTYDVVMSFPIRSVDFTVDGISFKGNHIPAATKFEIGKPGDGKWIYIEPNAVSTDVYIGQDAIDEVILDSWEARYETVPVDYIESQERTAEGVFLGQFEHENAYFPTILPSYQGPYFLYSYSMEPVTTIILIVDGEGRSYGGEFTIEADPPVVDVTEVAAMRDEDLPSLYWSQYEEIWRPFGVFQPTPGDTD